MQPNLLSKRIEPPLALHEQRSADKLVEASSPISHNGSGKSSEGSMHKPDKLKAFKEKLSPMEELKEVCSAKKKKSRQHSTSQGLYFSQRMQKFSESAQSQGESSSSKVKNIKQAMKSSEAKKTGKDLNEDV